MQTGVVGGVCMAHAPQFFTLPETEDKATVERVKALAGENGRRLKALKPDVTIAIANDHTNQFLLHCVPSFTFLRGRVAKGHFAGRDFRWDVAADVSTALLRYVQDEGFDPAFSSNADLDYSFGIPLTFLGIDGPIIPYGIGTFGSRATAVGGTAMYLAIQDLKEKMKKLAAHLLETTPDKVGFEADKFIVKGDSSRSLNFIDVVTAAYLAKKLPPGVEPGLEATRFFEPSNFTFPFGTHVCVVEVDGETGEPKVTKYVAVDDCGNVINPLLVEGQVHGGLVQGIAQALCEEVVYDENGQLLTGTLMDYALLRAHDLPEFELDRTITPSPVNPLGVKGVGEAGTIGSTPAVVNAVVDALAPLGVTHIDMPLRSEKIWKILKGRKAS